MSKSSSHWLRMGQIPWRPVTSANCVLF